MGLIVYGINELSEDFGGLSHLALLTPEEAQDLEFGDFFPEYAEDGKTPYADRLAVVEDFPALARALGMTAGEYLAEELLGRFMADRKEVFVPFLPEHDVAYVGRAADGRYVRAFVRASATWSYGVDLTPRLSGPLGQVVHTGEAQSREEAERETLRLAREVVNQRREP